MTSKGREWGYGSPSITGVTLRPDLPTHTAIRKLQLPSVF